MYHIIDTFSVIFAYYNTRFADCHILSIFFGIMTKNEKRYKGRIMQMRDKKQLYNIIAGVGLEIFTIIAGIMMIISLFVPVCKIEGVSTTYIGAISDTIEYAGKLHKTNFSEATSIAVICYVIIAIIIMIALMALVAAIVRIIQATIKIIRLENEISEGFKHIASLMIFMMMTAISAQFAGSLKAAVNGLGMECKISGYWIAVMAVTISGTVIGLVCHVIYHILEKKMVANILIYSVTGMVMGILLMVGAFCSMGTVANDASNSRIESITVGGFTQVVAASVVKESKEMVFLAVALLLVIVNYILLVACIESLRISMLGKKMNMVGIIVANIAIIAFEIAAMVMIAQADSEIKSDKLTIGAGLIVPLIMSVLVLILIIVKASTTAIYQNINGGQTSPMSNMSYENGVYTGQNNTYVQNVAGGQNMTGTQNVAGNYVYQNPLYRGKNN